MLLNLVVSPMLDNNTFYSHQGASYVLKVAEFTFENDSSSSSGTLKFP